MKYARVDTTLRDHPKALTAGPLAMGVWLGALLYSRDQLTDGFVPDAAIPTFFGGGHLNGRAAQKLVAIGLFSRVDGGYLVTGYAEKNDTKAIVTAAIEKKQKAQKKWKENMKREQGDNLQILSPHSHSHSLLSVSGEGEPERETAPAKDPTAEDRYAEAYAAGQRQVSQAPYPAPVEPWQRGAINRFTQTPGWGFNLRGAELLAAITAWSKAYRQARDLQSQYERGFPPQRCEEWARGAGWKYRAAPPPRALAALRTAPEEAAYVPDPGEAARALASIGKGGRQ